MYITPTLQELTTISDDLNAVGLCCMSTHAYLGSI